MPPATPKPQPKKPSKLFITRLPPSKELPKCTPNLMPFSIKYDGLAPVSTFMRVEKAKPNVGGPESESEFLKIERVGAKTNVVVEESTNTKMEGEDIEDVMCVDSETTMVIDSPNEVSTQTQELDVEENSLALAETSSSSVSTMGNTAHTNTFATSSSSSSSTLISAAATASVSQLTSSSSSSTLIPATSSASQSRFTSTFRGRTIHGLEIDVPEGYTGVVFRSEGDNQGGKVGMDSKKDLQKRGGKGKGKASIDLDHNRRSTRSTRGSRAKVIDVDEEEEDEEEEEVEEIDPNDALHLVPSSGFSSFVLWHPDLPVDTGKDEYFAAMKEWMKIAQVIHNVP